MERFTDDLRDCHGPDVETVSVMLTVETQGGAPSCVEPSPQYSAPGRCLAMAVARGLVIPDSPPEEACGFRYRVKLQ